MIEDDIKSAPDKLDTLIKCLPDAPYKAALLAEIERLQHDNDQSQEDIGRLYAEIDCAKASYEDALKDRVALANEVESLRAQRDEAMADAARYRYLRDKSNWTMCSIHGLTRFAARIDVAASFEDESGDELDVLLDAAIAKGADHG